MRCCEVHLCRVACDDDTIIRYRDVFYPVLHVPIPGVIEPVSEVDRIHAISNRVEVVSIIHPYLVVRRRWSIWNECVVCAVEPYPALACVCGSIVPPRVAPIATRVVCRQTPEHHKTPDGKQAPVNRRRSGGQMQRLVGLSGNGN